MARKKNGSEFVDPRTVLGSLSTHSGGRGRAAGDCGLAGAGGARGCRQSS